VKLQGTLLVIALFATGQAVAQQQTNTPSASTTITVKRQKFHWLAPMKKVERKNNLEYVEGLSPRAWTTIVGWHPGASAFPEAESSGLQVCLFWAGHEPWQ
jgi:hypothetical protein